MKITLYVDLVETDNIDACQKVYLIKEDKITTERIVGFKYIIEFPEEVEKQHTGGCPNMRYYMHLEPEEVFSTKEEFLNSIKPTPRRANP